MRRNSPPIDASLPIFYWASSFKLRCQSLGSVWIVLTEYGAPTRKSGNNEGAVLRLVHWVEYPLLLDIPLRIHSIMETRMIMRTPIHILWPMDSTLPMSTTSASSLTILRQRTIRARLCNINIAFSVFSLKTNSATEHLYSNLLQPPEQSTISPDLRFICKMPDVSQATPSTSPPTFSDPEGLRSAITESKLSLHSVFSHLVDIVRRHLLTSAIVFHVAVTAVIAGVAYSTYNRDVRTGYDGMPYNQSGVGFSSVSPVLVGSS